MSALILLAAAAASVAALRRLFARRQMGVQILGFLALCAGWGLLIAALV